ncbi:MAG: glycosyltransferase [Anaerolineae bacterium]|nr:glycosyltransferase [Anaerolineae bacterium]
MRFSVVTPTRNALGKLRRCVGSIRGQSGVDVEHIVQDACSTDGTGEWLSSQTDLRTTSEPDGGMYDAINRGWQHARGDVLSWLNSDEQYLPGTLKRIGAVFEQNPGVDFVYGDVLIVNASGDLIAARREIRLSKIYISNSFLNAPSCTTFFRRRLWDEGILRLDTAYRYAADMDLILRLLHAGKSYYKLSAYLSAFTMDGTNLSCHPGMLEETDMVQRTFGAFTSPLLRRAVTLGRYAERLLTGSYKRVDLAYEFASDEHPHYRTIIGRSLPGSYRTR